jgi:uncharacterized tellurite resistance protein B-like protein
MRTDKFQPFLLKSAITMMACDGDIDKDEVAEIKNMAENEIYFLGFDIEEPLTMGIDYIKSNGKSAVNEYLDELTKAHLNNQQELLLIEVILRTIMADSKVEDNEVKFLQLVITKLSIDQETLIMNFPKHINLLIDFNNYGLHEEFTEEITFEN